MQVCSTAQQIPEGWFLADCAVSGGSMEDYITQMLKASCGRLCVRLQPVYMDFTLPCLTGTGTAMSEAQFRRIHHGQNVFFSTSLCINYFTCVAEGAAHAILFDTANSLKVKYALLERCGVPMVLIEERHLLESVLSGFNC